MIEASITCTRWLIARFSRRVTYSMGGNRFEYSQQAKAFQALLDTLQQEQARLGGTPIFTGQSIAAKQSAAADTDLVMPDFRRHLQDDPVNDPVLYPGGWWWRG